MPTLPFAAFLEVRSATGGTFSPDGRTLAFLLNDTGVAQVYRLDSPGAPPRQLTDLAETVRSVHWSPDGTALLFTMDEGGSEREQLYVMRPNGTEQRRLTPDGAAIHLFGAWSPDGTRIAYAANSRNPEHFDIYVMEVATGTARRVLKRDGYFQVLNWSPSGAQLLVKERLSSYNEELYLLDLDTGELRHVSPHEGDALYTCGYFLPEGRAALVCTDQDRDFLCLARMELRTGRLQRLLERRADVELCELSADGRRLVALLNREGWSELVLARLRDRMLTGVASVPLPGVATSVRMARSGEPVAVSLHGPTQNSNVWSLDPDTTARTQWTRASMGSLTPQDLVEPEAVRYQSHDGLDIPALLYRPRGTEGQGLPVVVQVHGGPEGQDRPNFLPVYQYLVQRGCAVLAPNVRGSGGYGRAYVRMDDREKRYDALRDVEYAHHWLTRTGIGDATRIAIMGASYGGFTVLWCLTHQPELWTAGVDIVGIANFQTFFRNTGPWRRHLRASEYGDPEKDQELLRDLSPIHSVDQIRAPLMVVQGANDPRVPQDESDQMVARLRARNHPVEYLLFPDEGHGIVKIPNRIRAYTAIGDFLERYLLKE